MRKAPVSPDSRPTPTFALVVIAAVKVAVTVAFSWRYGYHRDELYYIASGRHLDRGYVDYPPFTPLLAHLVDVTVGTHLVTLRALAALAGGLVVVLTGLTVRELGGGRFAQLLGALLVACSPLFIGANLLFQTVSFDQLWWALTIYLLARLRRTQDPRLWLLIGLAVGTGLETKYTMLDLGLGIGAALLLSGERRHLRSPWPWAAGAIAFAIFVPNLLWQVSHGWPSVEYIRNHALAIRTDTPPGVFLVETVLFFGPFVVPFGALGAYRLWKERELRFFGWLTLVVTAALVLATSKSYYLGPMYPLLYAAGAIQLETVVAQTRRNWRRLLPVIAVVDALIPLPIGLPVLPLPLMVSSHVIDARKDYVDMVGWDELVDQVKKSYDALPADQKARTLILAQNYGEAGAIDLLGARRGLPNALSGHLTYYYWRPPHLNADYVLAVGFSPDQLRPYFADVQQVGTISNAAGVSNEEVGKEIAVCGRAKQALDKIWPQLKIFA